MQNVIFTVLVGFSLIALQVILAYTDNFLFVSQMLACGHQGIPLIAHAGVWGDLLFITPLAAWIVYAYRGQWNSDDIKLASAIGSLVTLALAFFWVSLTEHGLQEALAQNGQITPAGLFHDLYVAGAITIFLLFFFCSGVTRKAATIVAVILGIHLIYGTHIVLGLIGPDWFPDRPHKEIATWATILVSWGLLAWRCLTIRQ